MEDTEWQPSLNLESAINSYADSFKNLGKDSAAKELAELKVNSANTLLESYIDFLRTKIEEDFE